MGAVSSRVGILGVALCGVCLTSTLAMANPVDPDSLVVPEPKATPKRIAADEINQLLRTELSILEGVQELDMNMARRTAELERLDVQEKAVEKDLLEMTERFDALSDRLDEARRSIRGRLRAMSQLKRIEPCLLYTSPSPRDLSTSRMPSSA